MRATGEGGGHRVCSPVELAAHLPEHREPLSQQLDSPGRAGGPVWGVPQKSMFEEDGAW